MEQTQIDTTLNELRRRLERTVFRSNLDPEARRQLEASIEELRKLQFAMSERGVGRRGKEERTWSTLAAFVSRLASFLANTSLR